MGKKQTKYTLFWMLLISLKYRLKQGTTIAQISSFVGLMLYLF